jgi:phage baseplate assembly protein W
MKINPIDLQKNTAIGLKLPLVSDTKNFFTLNYETKNQIHSNLKNLLSTHKGERIMNPDFGTNLRKILFEQENIESSVIEEIEIAVEQWMNYVILDNIKVLIDNNVVRVKITYHTEYNDNLENLELTVS